MCYFLSCFVKNNFHRPTLHQRKIVLWMKTLKTLWNHKNILSVPSIHRMIPLWCNVKFRPFSHGAITCVPLTGPCFTSTGMHRFCPHPSMGIPIHVFWDTSATWTQLLCPNIILVRVHVGFNPWTHTGCVQHRSPAPAPAQMSHWEQWLCPNRCIPIDSYEPAGTGMHEKPVHPLVGKTSVISLCERGLIYIPVLRA